MSTINDITTTSGSPDQLVIGLAIGIPCGLIILLLVVLICVVVCITMCNSRAEDVEAMYMRRRFQGLSLEEQRKRQTMGRGRNKFVSKRRSSGLDTKSSTQLPTSSRARVIRANPFGLQDWQLKLSGIDVTVDGDTEVTEVDNDLDSPRSPVGALNPLLLQHFPPGPDQVQPSYEPVQHITLPPSPPRAGADRSHHPSTSWGAAAPGPAQHRYVEEDGDSSDSFNPYD